MPDDLYERHTLVSVGWQACLPRRAANGEHADEVDWDHVVEEIENARLPQLTALRRYPRHMRLHASKIDGRPDSPSAEDWRN
jgi:hypothetical protein